MASQLSSQLVHVAAHCGFLRLSASKLMTVGHLVCILAWCWLLWRFWTIWTFAKMVSTVSVGGLEGGNLQFSYRTTASSVGVTASYRRVVSVGLSRFTQIKDLRFLAISQNFIFGEIPASLGEIHRIRTLDLSYNQLAGTISPSIGSLPELSQFDSLPQSLNRINPSVSLAIANPNRSQRQQPHRFNLSRVSPSVIEIFITRLEPINRTS
ncbi:unnamed protein product [Brassica napus]|uniref:(rape) hypothetical protein n=1 Tax=Brassica napus TaxID=3708 RepID=A0A816TNE6_BRANA|nr:unnamed protein product [Brassica napus]